jgi:hypothetical protein
VIFVAAAASPYVGGQMQKHGARSTRAVVNLAGMINDNTIHRRALMSLDLSVGDVYWAIYPRFASFPAPRIVSDLADAVFDYVQIHINGASIGALMACDLIDELRRRNYSGTIHVILVHPCTRLGLKLIPWRVLTKPKLEDGVAGSENLLAHQSFMSSQMLKNGFWPQLRYILTHRAPRLKQYQDVPAIVVAPSKHDPLLRTRSARAFNLAFDAQSWPVHEAGHCDFVEQPSRWWRIFDDAYSSLNPNG